MASRVDSLTSMHTPGGRHYQIEYATEAVSLATTCLAIVTEEGIVVAAERKAPKKIFEDVFPKKKVFRLNENMVCGVAGIASEAQLLIDEMRSISERIYGDGMSCEELVIQLTSVQRKYTQDADKRPFGASVLYLGWDSHSGFQLFESEPSGNYDKRRATCIGYNFRAAKEMLRQEFIAKEGGEKLTLEDGHIMAIKVLSMTLETSKLSPDHVEMGVLKRCEFQTVYIPMTRKQLKCCIERCSTVQRMANRRNSVAMARRAAFLTKMLSPGGGQYQTKLAVEAVSRSATCLGILTSEGIVLAVERRGTNQVINKYLPTQKIFRLNENMVCGATGFTSDANLLVAELRQIIEAHQQIYEFEICCELMVSILCDIKQNFAQSLDKRPFGVSMIYLCWDLVVGFRLLKSDPRGEYKEEYTATAIGYKFDYANAMLKKELVDKKNVTLTLEDAKILAIKILSKVLATKKMTPEQVEMGTLQRSNDETVFSLLKKNELNRLFRKCNVYDMDYEDDTEDEEMDPDENFLSTTFLPEGRRYQIDYALEAVSHAEPCLGIVAKDGVVLVGGKAKWKGRRRLSEYPYPSAKIFCLNEDVACGFVGITADANALMFEMRRITELLKPAFKTGLPCHLLVSNLCAFKAEYTHCTDKRMFAVSILYMSWNVDSGFQLFISDPLGNNNENKAICVGRNSGVANAMLMNEMVNYGDEKMTLDQAKILAIKVLSKTLETSQLSAEQVEMGTLRRILSGTFYTKVEDEELKTLIEKCGTLQ